MVASNAHPRGAHRRVIAFVAAVALTVPLMLLEGGVSSAASCTSPTFGAATAIAAAAGTIAVADYDVDGTPDVIVGNQLRYGDGAGGFVAPQTVPGVRAISAVDLGGVTPAIGINNAAPELLAESTVTPGRAVVGLGSGSRSSPFSGLAGFPVMTAPDGTPSPVLAGVTADLTGDGIPDLAYSQGAGTSKVFIWVGETMSPNWGSEVAPTELDIVDASAMVAGDFDDDGVAELVVATTSGNALVVVNHDPGGFLQKGVAVAGGPQGLAAADVNGDGFLDAVVTTASGNLVTLRGTGESLRTNPSGSNPPVIGNPFGAPTTLAVGGDLRGIALADATGDQRFDAAVADRTGQRVVVVIGNGSGAFSSPTAFATGSAAPTSVSLTDLDHDGALDLISGDATDSKFVTRRNGCTATPVDLEVTGVEVTQVIQDLANSVPLIADRRTVVRVQVRAGIPVDGVTARLARTDSNGTVIDRPLWPGNADGRITVKASADRTRLGDSFQFELPSAWVAAGTLYFKVDVNPDKLPAESSYANNTAARSVTFLASDPIKIELIKVSFFTEKSSGTDTGCDQYSEPTDSDLDAAESALRRQIPAAKFVFTRDRWDSGLRFPCTINVSLGVESQVFMDAFLTKYAGVPRDRIRLGIYTRPFIGGQVDVIGGWFAVSNTSVDIVVHEIGHALRQEHKESPTTPPCSRLKGAPGGTVPYPYPDARIGGPAGTEQYVGYDPGDGSLRWPEPRRVVGPDVSDLMSYCQFTWPSNITWVGMRDGIDAKFSPTDPSGDFLTIRATYDPAIASVTGLTATRSSQLGALNVPVPGPLHLRQLAAGGALLADNAFTPAASVDGAVSQIDVTVNFAAGLRQIAITDAGGITLATIAVSPNVPIVSNIGLSSGSAIPGSGPITISWSAADSDGDPLVADVLWSNDGGATFAPLAGNVTGSSYTVDGSAFAGTSGSTDGVVRVLVHDPVNTGSADLAHISAIGSPPRVRIAAPFENESFVRGQIVSLQAYAGDREDGDLDGSIEWVSNRDGALGSGGSRTVLLSAGTHLLTARVTDVDGNLATATATVHIFSVLPPGSPPVANAGADRTVLEGASVTLDGTGSSDPDGDPIGYSWVLVEGPGGVGSVMLDGPTATPSFVALQSGTYRFRLTVFDGLHGESSDEVTVTVLNVAPTVSIASPATGALFAAGVVALDANYADPGRLDTHTCSITWDVDQGTAPVAGTIDAAARTCRASRTLGAGVYTIRVDVTDDAGATGSATVMVIVYDPSAGFVTGGGWIDSAAGSYVADSALTGRADFGFVSKYKKGAAVPTGETEFQFRAGTFTFRSDAYQWLVVTGCKAQYKGTGTVNGVAGYGFLLTATDGDICAVRSADKFRIKVWTVATGVVVYDNKLGGLTDIDSANPQVIGGGSIVIRK